MAGHGSGYGSGSEQGQPPDYASLLLQNGMYPQWFPGDLSSDSPDSEERRNQQPSTGGAPSDQQRPEFADDGIFELLWQQYSGRGQTGGDLDARFSMLLPQLERSIPLQTRPEVPLSLRTEVPSVQYETGAEQHIDAQKRRTATHEAPQRPQKRQRIQLCSAQVVGAAEYQPVAEGQLAVAEASETKPTTPAITVPTLIVAEPVEADESEPADKFSSRGKIGWRKYGQKNLKVLDASGNPLVRCYYKCNQPSCKARKQSDMDANRVNIKTKIIGDHNHAMPADPAPPVMLTSAVLRDRVDAPVAGPMGNTMHQRSLAQLGQLSMPFTQSAVGNMANLSAPGGEAAPIMPQAQHEMSRLLSNATFIDMMKQNHPMFVVCDPTMHDCPIIFASSGFCHHTGYELQEILGRNCRFLQGKDTNKNAVKQIRIAIEQAREVCVTLLNYKKDGTPFWNLLHLSPVRRCFGRVVSYAGSQINITNFMCANGPATPSGPSIDDAQGKLQYMYEHGGIQALRNSIPSQGFGF